MKMRPGLDMDRDRIRPGFREGGKIGVARGDHKMHVERNFCVRAQGAHHRRANRDVWHEMAVHDVDMNPIGTGADNRPDFFAEIGEIGGQYRGRNDQRRHLVLPDIS